MSGFLEANFNFHFSFSSRDSSRAALQEICVHSRGRRKPLIKNTWWSSSFHANSTIQVQGSTSGGPENVKLIAIWREKMCIFLSVHCKLFWVHFSPFYIHPGSYGKWIDNSIFHSMNRNGALLKFQPKTLQHFLCQSYQKIISKVLKSFSPLNQQLKALGKVWFQILESGSRAGLEGL